MSLPTEAKGSKVVSSHSGFWLNFCFFPFCFSPLPWQSLVSSDLKEITGLLEARQLHSNGAFKTLIVQEYIDRPLLFHKRKFDIRCYTLFTSVNGFQKGRQGLVEVVVVGLVVNFRSQKASGIPKGTSGPLRKSSQ